MDTKKSHAYSIGQSKTTSSITEFGFGSGSRGKRGKGTTEACQFSHATYSSSCDLALTGLAQSLVFIMGSSEDSTEYSVGTQPPDELRKRDEKLFRCPKTWPTFLPTGKRSKMKHTHVIARPVRNDYIRGWPTEKSNHDLIISRRSSLLSLFIMMLRPNSNGQQG